MIQRLIILTTLLASLWNASAQVPDDLVPITDGYPVTPTAWFSMAHWPVWPPFPLKSIEGDEYYSPSWGADTIFVDDLLSTYNRFERNGINPWEPGDPVDTNAPMVLDVTNWPPPPDPQTDHTNLLIGIINVTNLSSGWYANLIIYNTTNTLAYEIVSSADVRAPLTNWHSEGVWSGIVSNTPAQVPWLDRTNQLFFRARVFDGSFSNGFPNNGSLVIQLANSGPLVGLINHVSNSIPTLASNFIVLHPPLWEVNLGYDASDYADETNWLTRWPSNNSILNVYGRSDTISNLCLSYSAVTNIDVHGWANLYDLEAWHCTNIVAQNVSNCPRLHRVCFESSGPLHGIQNDLDFTGSPAIADVRAALCGFHNVIWGPGGGTNVFHFCTHDSWANHYTEPTIVGMPFTNSPALRQLWCWTDGSFRAPVNLAYTNCPHLDSVQANNNWFQTINLYGQTNLTNAILKNCSITNIDVRGCTKLKLLDCTDNFMTSPAIDAALAALDSLGTSNGACSFTTYLYPGWNNGAPSSSGAASAANLRARGWSVGINDSATNVPAITQLFAAPASNGCTITWNTWNVPSDSRVYYGTNSATNLLLNLSQSINHTGVVTGLDLNTLYQYAVTSVSGTNSGSSPTNSFRTLGRGPNTNPITFVSLSSNVAMQCSVAGNATIKWLWGDGTSNVITSALSSVITNSFSTEAARTNRLVVDPEETLVTFGAACQDEGNHPTRLASITGLSNYPNMNGLFAYFTGLTNMSIAGLTNLGYVAAVATFPGEAQVNQWINDLNAAQASITTIPGAQAMCSPDTGNTFYVPIGTPLDVYSTNSSYSAQTNLINKRWYFYFGISNPQ
jgi:hypothetical protein